MHSFGVLQKLPQSNQLGMQDLKLMGHFTHPQSTVQPFNCSCLVGFAQFSSGGGRGRGWGGGVEGWHDDEVLNFVQMATYAGKRMSTAHSHSYF